MNQTGIFKKGGLWVVGTGQGGGFAQDLKSHTPG